MPLKSLEYATREPHHRTASSATRTASYTLFALALLLFFVSAFAPADYRTGETGMYVFWAFPMSVVLSATGIVLAGVSLAMRRGA